MCGECETGKDTLLEVSLATDWKEGNGPLARYLVPWLEKYSHSEIVAFHHFHLYDVVTAIFALDQSVATSVTVPSHHLNSCLSKAHTHALSLSLSLTQSLTLSQRARILTRIIHSLIHTHKKRREFVCFVCVRR